MPVALAYTALHDIHVRLRARMVPFAGWDMPVQYEGIIAEHRAVRSAWGIFDVSHMGRVYLTGAGASPLLDRLITSDIAGLSQGQARYGMMCVQNGGILDDVIVLRLHEDQFLLVCNASNRKAVLDWVRSHIPAFPSVEMIDRTAETVMVAAQGPRARQKIDSLLQGRLSLLKRYAGTETEWDGEDAVVTRTGYTGEDGFEIIVRSEVGSALWEQLMDLGAVPCGLGARDTLRLEAGLPLHGQEIDLATNPVEAGLGRFVKLDGADFIGKAALLETQRNGLAKKLVAFKAARGPVPRHGFPILHEGATVGHVTSGGFSPTLQITIGLGYVPPGLAEPGTRLLIDARGRLIEAEAVRLPFYKRPQS